MSLALIALALGHLALLARLLRARAPGALALTLGLPLAGMAYDGLVLGAGSSLGAGPLLQALNVPRFVLHALLTPLWVVAAGTLAREAGLAMATTPALRAGLGVTAALLVAAEVRHLGDLDLVPVAFGDTLRYTRGAPGGPPVGALGTLAVVLALAPFTSRWILLAGLLLLVLAAAPMSKVGPLPGNVGELLLAAALVHAAARPAPGPVPAPAPEDGGAPR